MIERYCTPKLDFGTKSTPSAEDPRGAAGEGSRNRGVYRGRPTEAGPTQKENRRPIMYIIIHNIPRYTYLYYMNTYTSYVFTEGV